MEVRPPRSYRLTLAYDGTGLVGWQRQARGVSVQGLLEEALEALEGAPVQVVGAGRTDAGVHAIGQVASCTLTRTIEVPVLQRALNALLPPAVRVVAIGEVPLGYNARFAARLKTYHYALSVGAIASPFEHRHVWHLAGPLDTASMTRAALGLVGRHDFSAFRSAGSSVRTATRTIVRSEFRRARPGEPAWVAPPVAGGAERWLYEVTGDGFLRHMVRAIVGLLVEVGRGRRQVSDVEKILAGGDRAEAGPTAPAHGLCLVSVE